MSKVTRLAGQARSHDRINVIRNDADGGDFELHGDSAFLTIGAGETHLCVLDAEGSTLARWTAIFGWSALGRLNAHTGNETLKIETPADIRRALSGGKLFFGRTLDTGKWFAASQSCIADALEQILAQTIGSGSSVNGIYISAPEWLHGALASSLQLRPHIELKTD